MTAPLHDADHRRIDQKVTAVLAVTIINLILLVLAAFNVIDLAHQAP